jgi:hypothetical protein
MRDWRPNTAPFPVNTLDRSCVLGGMFKTIIFRLFIPVKSATKARLWTINGQATSTTSRAKGKTA